MTAATNDDHGTTRKAWEVSNHDESKVTCSSWCAFIPNYVNTAYGVDDREPEPRKLVRSPYKPETMPPPIDIPPLHVSRSYTSSRAKHYDSDSSIHEMIANIEPFPISPLSPLPPLHDEQPSLQNHSSYSSVDIEHEEVDGGANQTQLQRAVVHHEIKQQARTSSIPKFERGSIASGLDCDVIRKIAMEISNIEKSEERQRSAHK
eukprot:CAMPEP_0197028974 /NCGR_PEP_ID=MMETSP1384-20130603/8532_1 /TAXON_ID=29189 /ORGANISM="Ammonia sp." /LENGTH=204 /DNA_ID=CAMNT_0042458059 /DNA_START=118 /DNA_END=732 /DNA_ORIENTATION=-